MTVCLYAVIFVVALLLIVLILIQPSKSGGMGAAFGGIGESVFGGKAGSHLTKTTVVMTTIFFVVALVLAAVIGHESGGKDDDWRKKLSAQATETSNMSSEAPVKQDALKSAEPEKEKVSGEAAEKVENKDAEKPADKAAEKAVEKN